MVERRDGRIALMGDGVTTVAGPFTLEARQEILTRLLAVEKEVGMPLINEDEIARIRSDVGRRRGRKRRNGTSSSVAQLRGRELT